MAAKTKVKIRRSEIIGGFADELGTLGEATIDSLNKQVVKGFAAASLDQIGISLGLTESPKPKAEKAPEANQDPTKGPVEIVSFDVSKLTPAEIAERQARAKKEKRTSNAEAPIDHGRDMVNALKTGARKEQQQQRSEVEELRSELHRIVQKTKDTKYDTHTLNEAPKQVGKGTVAFFRGIVNSARISEKDAANSGTWLKVGKQKQGFKATTDLSKEKSQSVSPG